MAASCCHHGSALGFILALNIRPAQRWLTRGQGWGLQTGSGHPLPRPTPLQGSHHFGQMSRHHDALTSAQSREFG